MKQSSMRRCIPSVGAAGLPKVQRADIYIACISDFQSYRPGFRAVSWHGNGRHE